MPGLAAETRKIYAEGVMRQLVLTLVLLATFSLTGWCGVGYYPVPVAKDDIRIFREMNLREADYEVEKYRITFDRPNWIWVEAQAQGKVSDLPLPKRASAVNLLLLTQKKSRSEKTIHFVVSGEDSSVYSYLRFDPAELLQRTFALREGRFLLLGMSAVRPSDFAYVLQVFQSDIAPRPRQE